MFSLGQDQRKEIIFAIFIRICLTIKKIDVYCEIWSYKGDPVIMSKCSQNISRSQRQIWGLTMIVILWIRICGDFSAEKRAKNQIEEILNDTVTRSL